MTADPFLDPPTYQAPSELDAGLELGGCARVLLAVFGMLSVLAAGAALAEARRR